MTDGHDCYQNALAEKVNGILKQEFLITRCNRMEGIESINYRIGRDYNCYRPHLSLEMLTPNQMYEKAKTKLIANSVLN